MKHYKDWSPTEHDAKGLGPVPGDWLVGPVMLTRDSNAVGRSNWTVITGDVADHATEGDDYQIHRFGHWAVGWIEIIVARPDSEAARVLASWEAGLADYPIADDEHLFSEEDAEAARAWETMRERERIAWLRDHPRDMADRLETFADVLACVRRGAWFGFDAEHFVSGLARRFGCRASLPRERRRKSCSSRASERSSTAEAGSSSADVDAPSRQRRLTLAP